MSLENLMISILGNPEYFINDVNGAIRRIIDIAYLSRVFILALIVFMIFYGSLNLIRLIGGKKFGSFNK